MADNDAADNGPDRVKLTITGLTPDKDYALQVRSFNDKGHSAWSENFKFATISDKSPVQGEGQGAPNRPKMITGITWVATPEGFLAEWNPVVRDGNGSKIVVKHYEIEITYLNSLDRTVTVVPTGEGRQSRLFTSAELVAMYREPVPKLKMKIRVVNSADNRSLWSDPLEAEMGVPDPPTDAVALPINDGIVWSWTPPANMNNVLGYRVYVGLVSGGAGFVTSAANKVYEGALPGFTFSSTTYAPHYFKIRSYSAFGSESVDLLAVGTPKSPFGEDLTPPTAPVITSATLNKDNPAAAIATLNWTFDSSLPENKDLTYFVSRHRVTGTTYWEYTTFNKDLRSGNIPIRNPFGNYEFQMAAYDLVGNYPTFIPDPPFKLEGGIPGPPPKTVGVVSTGNLFGIAFKWTESVHEDVKYAGHYEVQIAKNNAFTTGLLTYATANTYLDLVGLEVGTTYYTRIRAVDSTGLAGEWSDTDVESTGNFPDPPKTDGLPPTTSPAARVFSGMGFLNVSWDTVTNRDPVTYQVHMSTTAAFVPTMNNTTTMVTKSTGTSATISTLPTGAALVTGTTYYFRIIATDEDTTPANAPAAGTVGNGTVKQIGPADLGINMPGENLYFNSSFDEDSNGDGLANYWSVLNGSAAAQPTTTTMVTGRAGGKAQRVAWAVANTTTKGVLSNSPDGTVIRPNTDYVLSFYARANAGTGFSVTHAVAAVAGSTAWMENPTPSSTEWKRYVYKFKTGATVDPANAGISIAGHSSANGWLEIDDAQIEAGNMVSAYKPGTISIAKLTTGKLASAEFTIAQGGLIKSENYNATTQTGFALGQTGLTIYNGEVSAAALKTGTAIIGALNVTGSLTVAAGGEIKSTDYSNDPANLKGFRMTSVGLDIAKGVIRAETITGKIVSPDVRIGAGGTITVDDAGTIKSNTYSYNPVTDTGTGWKIDKNGIEIWGSSSLIRAEAFKGGTFSGNYFKVGTGGFIESEDYNEQTRIGWRLGRSGTGQPVMNLFGGKIFGSTVETDQMYSAMSTQDAMGNVRRVFSLNSEGYAAVQGLQVWGNAIIGDPNNPNTGSTHTFRSANWASGSNGWMLRGDGYAEFNSGSIQVGDLGGGRTQLVNIGGRGELRFYEPSSTGSYHVIRTNGLNELGVFGASGAHVKFFGGANVANGEGGDQWLENLVQVAQNFHVTQLAVINNGLRVNYGGIKASGGLVTTGGVHLSGAIQFPGLGKPTSAAVGQVAVTVGDSGVLSRGSSSKRYKDNIKPLTVKTDAILALEPKSFKWNREDMGYANDIGFIAEDAHDLGLTEYVLYDEINGEVVPDGFNYMTFVTALQQVNRAQQDEIDLLKARLDSLEARA